MTARRDLIARAILDLLAERGEGKSICPSEAARQMENDEDAWRALMPEIRSVAADLADRGEVVVTQKGSPVDIRTVQGPIRIRSART